MADAPMSKDEATRLCHRSIIRERLVQKGVERVRAELADRVGFSPFQLGIMQEWLDEKQAEAEAFQQSLREKSEREVRMEASNAESLRIARSAKNAAWAAAIAAIIAIVVSVFAIIIPLLSK